MLQLPRQRNHVFRSNNCCLLVQHYVIFVVAIPIRHQATFFVFCLVMKALTRCRSRKATNGVTCSALFNNVLRQSSGKDNKTFQSGTGGIPNTTPQHRTQMCENLKAVTKFWTKKSPFFRCTSETNLHCDFSTIPVSL